MRTKITTFFILFIIFSVGLFFGEWLLDIIFKSEREILKVEIMESVIIGLIVALLFVIGNRSLRKNRN